MTTTNAESQVLHQGQKLSLDEFLRRWENMPELKKAELIGGVVYMQSAMRIEHGGMDYDIAMWLRTYSLRTPGTHGAGNVTTRLSEHLPQPDHQLRLLPEAGGRTRIERGYVTGAPEFVVEVCASSKDYDLGVKKDLYEAEGVDEYVAVLLDEPAIRWHRLEGGAYRIVPADADGIWRSKVFPGLWLDGAALLEGDATKLLAELGRGLESPEHAEFVEELGRRMRSKP